MKEILYFSKWKKLGIDAGITTKSFPLCLQKTADLDQPANRIKFSKLFNQNRRFAYCHQVHGSTVSVLQDGKSRQKTLFQKLKATDGILTNIPGLTLLVMTADCLSIFLAAPGWVGVVHAGWRGTREKILEKAACLLADKSGSDPKNIRAIFGPSICGRHYEVGEEFGGYFSAPVLKKRKGRLYFDLVRENTRQLRRAGVPARNISKTGFCTISENEKFYSFRLEKESAGRMISFIRLGV